MDRKVTFQSDSPTISNTGARTASFSTIATVWAQWTPKGLTGDEGEDFESNLEEGISQGTFKIRKSSEVSSVSVADRAVFESRNWDIVNITQDGRNNRLIISVETREQ